MAIKRQREILIEAGMDGKQQDAKWKDFKGVQLLNKQKLMIESKTIPSNKKGGHR